MLRSFCIVLFGVLHVSGQVQSPCPSTFEYKNDAKGVFGLMRVKPQCRDAQLMVKVSFTVAARLQNNFVGSIMPLGNFTTNNCENPKPIEYRVNFPLSNPIPRITMITANGNTICSGPGDKLDVPFQYVSTVNLEHIIHFKTQSSAEFRQQSIYKKIITPQLILEEHAVESKLNVTYDPRRPLKVA